MTLYTVRQYRPSFFEGFENAVVEHVDEKDLMNPKVLPWLDNFQHEGFVEFYTEKPYAADVGRPWAGDVLISARYADKKHWVAAIAQPEPIR